MPLPGALLDSDDDDVPSTVAAPGTPKVVAPGVGRAAQSHTDESLSQQYIGHGRLSSLIQTTDSAASDDSTRNVRARTEVPGAGNSLPGMAAVSTPMALSRTPSTGWGVGLVAVTPMAAPATPTATPTATPAASATAKVSSVLSPQNSPKAIQAPSRITAEPLSRTGSSEGSDSDGGEGLSKGILADRIESVQREIDQLNAEIQVTFAPFLARYLRTTFMHLPFFQVLTLLCRSGCSRTWNVILRPLPPLFASLL
jgi:hypothetical protein